MPTELSGVTIIHTKLRAPKLPSDLVEREVISGQLAEGIPPLLLVCASAGQGKTIAIADWLERTGLPHCWYSVDDHDSDLRIFMSHLVQGITGISGHECEETAKLLQLDQLPGIPTLAGALSNDLDALSPPLMIVLDDFHDIRGTEVPDFLDRLLDYLPSGISIIIATRSAPAIGLNRLKGRNQMIQLGDASLQFDPEDSEQFFSRAVDQTLNRETLGRLRETTNGWAVGMRLAALALNGQDNIQLTLGKIDGGAKPLLNYLFDEVLSRFSEAMVDCLSKLSCVELFNLSLAEAVVDDAAQWQICKSELKQGLQGVALQCTSMGGEENWYFFHNVFRELLQHQAANYSSGERTQICRRAARWHEQQGDLELAVTLSLRSGNEAEAGALMLRQRNLLTQSEQWVRLASLLKKLPLKYVEREPELLILKSWSIDIRDQIEGDTGLLAKAERLLSEPGPWSESRERLHAEIAAIRSSLLYHDAQGKEAAALARLALEKLPESSISERAFTHILLATSLQMTGDLPGALAMILKELGHLPEKGTTRHGRLLITLCFLHWIAADMLELENAATAALNIGQAHNLQQTENYGRYFLGLAHHQVNDLEKAARVIEPIFSGDRVPSVPIYLLAVPLRFTLLHAQGKTGEAADFASAISRFVLEGGITSHLESIQSLNAKIALWSGQLPTAVRWAKNLQTEYRQTPYGSIMPELIAARVLIAERSPDSLKEAKIRLDHSAGFLEPTHNVRFQIDLHLTKALWAEAMGDEGAGMESLSEAVRLAQPGVMIRTFVDHGPVIRRWLGRAETDQRNSHYIGSILQAFREQPGIPKIDWVPGPAILQTTDGEFLESLSKREHEVLHHLALRRSNKEIASALFISAGTVKRHTSSIYQKLGVHGRQEAVTKARSAGILR